MSHGIVRLTRKGQLALPVDIRKRLKLSGGDYLALTLEGEEIRIKYEEQQWKKS